VSGKRHLQPDGLFQSRPFGFTHVVTSPPGRLVFVSGQVAADAELHTVGGDDLAAQTEQALANLQAALGAAGAKPADVTLVRAYIVDFDPRDGRVLAPAFARFFGDPPPASTWVGVTGLAGPDYRIEIEAIAVVAE
jgi:enamine deaminase RidA (YjgF/YER057c/UK114 family)